MAQKRWIHVDPSDNIVDAPLMYQHGWKRDVVYVMAFSRDDFQDVTWKYHSDHQKLLSNRKNCKEIELLKAILLIREKRQQNCSAIRKKYLKKRALVELMEMLVPRQPTENEKRGRSSGSLSWKLARGEMQSSNNVNTILGQYFGAFVQRVFSCGFSVLCFHSAVPGDH